METVLKVKNDGKFKKGEIHNPKGRPRVPEIELVRQAIAETEREKKKSLWKLLIEKCYEDNMVLIALAKKFLPDKIEADVKAVVDIDKEKFELIELLKKVFAKQI